MRAAVITVCTSLASMPRYSPRKPSRLQKKQKNVFTNVSPIKTNFSSEWWSFASWQNYLVLIQFFKQWEHKFISLNLAATVNNVNFSFFWDRITCNWFFKWFGNSLNITIIIRVFKSIFILDYLTHILKIIVQIMYTFSMV